MDEEESKLAPGWGQHHIGARIRFITNKDSTGTIHSKPSHSPHGGLRQDVRWDGSGDITAWNPVFLVPIHCDDAEIPDRISDASGYVYNKATNTLSPPPRRIEATAMQNGLAMFKLGKK